MTPNSLNLIRRLQHIQYTRHFLPPFSPWLHTISSAIYQLTEDNNAVPYEKEPLADIEQEISQLETCHQTLKKLMSLRQALEKKCLHLKEKISLLFLSSSQELVQFKEKIERIMHLLRIDINVLFPGRQEAVHYIEETSSQLNQAQTAFNSICYEIQSYFSGMQEKMKELKIQHKIFLDEIHGTLSELAQAGFSQGIQTLVKNLHFPPPQDLSEKNIRSYQKQIELVSSQTKKELELIQLRETQWMHECKWLGKRIHYWYGKLAELLNSPFPEKEKNKAYDLNDQLKIIEHRFKTAFLSFDQFKEGQFEQKVLVEEVENALQTVEKFFKNLEANQKALFDELDIFEDSYKHHARVFHYHIVLIPYPDLKNQIEKLLFQAREEREKIRKRLFTSLGTFYWNDTWKNFVQKQQLALSILLEEVQARTLRINTLSDHSQSMIENIQKAQYPIQKAAELIEQLFSLISTLEKRILSEIELTEAEKKVLEITTRFKEEQQQAFLDESLQTLYLKYNQEYAQLQKNRHTFDPYPDLILLAKRYLTMPLLPQKIHNLEELTEWQKKLAYKLEKAQQAKILLEKKAEKRRTYLKELEKSRESTDQLLRELFQLTTSSNGFSALIKNLLSSLATLNLSFEDQSLSWKQSVIQYASTLKKISSASSMISDLIRRHRACVLRSFTWLQKAKHQLQQSSHTIPLDQVNTLKQITEQLLQRGYYFEKAPPLHSYTSFPISFTSLAEAEEWINQTELLLGKAEQHIIEECKN